MIVGNVCCLGWGGIIVDWEYRGSAVHTILISPYQKKAKQSLPVLVRDLHIVQVCFLRYKRAGILFEIGISFIFKEQQMTRITSLNTTLKSLENQNAPQKQHKRAAKRDF